MTTKTNIIISILKNTNNGPVVTDTIVREINIPVKDVNIALEDLREIGLIECENERIELSSNQRVELAIHAINQRIDIERVCKFLEWKEFEKFTATAFEKNNFAVKRNFRFKAAQRRWEIDVLAYFEPIIVCVDCKRWRRGWGKSAIKRVAAAQSQRTKVFARSLHYLQKQIRLDNWKYATVFPVILSLFPGNIKYFNKVPVVPILQLQSFVNEFQGHTSELKHFKINLEPKLSEYINRSH